MGQKSADGENSALDREWFTTLVLQCTYTTGP